MALGGLGRETRAYVAGEVPAVSFVQGLVDPLRQEVPLAPADDSLGYEDHYLVQVLKLTLIMDTLFLVAAEAAGMVNQENVVSVHRGIAQGPPELETVLDASATHEFGVPAIAEN
jgi:hypothetical protein